MNKNDKTKSYDIEEINEARRKSGLKEIHTKTKKCLRCEQEFVSQGNHNRLCNYCRRNNVRAFI